jgi:diguanylate cyclase (GGDEF)-like protein/PAS domain S-box-containing protein
MKAANFYIFIVTLFISMTLSFPVSAQQQDIKFEHLSLNEGLSQSTINAIFQDSHGFMWFGTQDGLNKYDGYRFTVYRHSPQDANSLSHNEIFAIYEDSTKTLWIGTSGGLNQFDRQHDNFKHYFHDPQNPTSLSDNTISAIYEDDTGSLWIGTRHSGLNLFERQQNKFRRFKHEADNPNSLSHNSVWPIYQDKHGILWIGTDGGGLNKFEGQQITHYQPDTQNPDSSVITSIYEDSTNTLWVGTMGGLHKFDRQRQTFGHYLHDPQNPYSLSSNKVWAISEDNQGFMWIATDGGGLNRFDRKLNQFVHFKHEPYNATSLSENAVLSIYKDRVGTLWVGTGGSGVNWFNHEMQKFKHYFHYHENHNALDDSHILSIFQDRQSILWVGTLDGGLNQFDKTRQKVTHYLHDPHNPNSLSHNEVRSIYEDSTGTLWVGTYGGGLNRFNREQKKFKIYQHNPIESDSLNSNYVLAIYEDNTNTLWVGTKKGLDKFERQTDTFKHYINDSKNPASLSHNEISAIYEDKTGILWIGTQGGGLNKFVRLMNKFVRYQHDRHNPTSLSHDEVSVIYADKANTLWIGTFGGGLNKFDRLTETFQNYREPDGLLNDTIYGILEDRQGYLWLSSNKGLSKFNPRTLEFRHYNVLDGLQSNEFNTVSYKSTNGELFFGGINGFNAFYPERIKDNSHIPPIVLTDFKIFNKSVGMGENSPLQSHISTTKELTLSYKQSFFSFEFAALNFLQPTKNEYAYKLEGFDNDWNEIGSRRNAYYTKVPHGDYIFRVKGSNNDKVWNEQGTAIKVTILPPYWKTWWASNLYVLTVLIIIIGYIRAQRQKLLEKQQELEQEQKIATQLRETDRLKDEFLANTSHELRTPLNGIIGIAESLIDGATGKLSQTTNTNLKMIVSSGRRLFNLVNDILDFSRLKEKEIDLQMKALDIRTIAEVVLALNQPLIGQKPVKLINAIASELPPIKADENRVQQILYNLVGNAIKFTDSGTITVSAKLETEHPNILNTQFLTSNSQLKITVSDTGIGIASGKLDRIFEAFEQADGSTARIYGGTGLGLAVTQQLVKLHGGQMQVQSQINQGSQFSFTLPLAGAEIDSQPTTQLPVINYQLPEENVQSSSEPKSSFEVPKSISSPGKFNILIVDDEPVNRQVLVNHLSLQNYSLSQAASGVEALAFLERGYNPDIILLDVMMPHISGYEVTQEIRKTQAADELPIILLTAKTQVADLVVGLESGANDYLTKPTSKDELLARIKTHLNILQLKQARQIAEKKYREIFENVMEGIFQCSPTGYYINVNPAFVHIFGYDSAEQIYAEITDIKQQMYVNPQCYVKFESRLQTHSNVQGFEHQAHCRNGSIIWVKETVHVVYDNEGKIHHYEGIIEDITKRKQAEEQLRYDATHDQLTGLFNRAIFTSHVNSKLEGTNYQSSETCNQKSTEPNLKFAVLFIDLDRFKIVNDSMGHLVGDQLLIEIARRLKQEITANEIVARFGGDEFALMLEDFPNLIILEQRIGNILHQLSQPYLLKNETFNSTVSIGIALSDPKYNNADEILRDADTAMYEAKKQGGGCSVIFQAGMHSRVVNILRMESDLRKALEREEFCLHYQPVISLETNQIVAVEALVRWEHPQHGLIRPDLFIPLAEESGLIKELGLWVFEKACLQLRRWQTQFSHHTELGMNINVSPIQLKQPYLVHQIQDIIDKTGIKASTCRVEITESAMMQNPKAALTVLDDLKNLGVLLYVDDFGTGYSSLSYLQQFPIDALKIDKSFIQKIDASSKSAQVTYAIIALGKAFNLRIVAEGVENDFQLSILKAAHCHYVQGYFFSRPKDAQSIEIYLSDNYKDCL